MSLKLFDSHQLFSQIIGMRISRTQLAKDERYLSIEFNEIGNNPKNMESVNKGRLVTNSCAWRLVKNGVPIVGSIDIPILPSASLLERYNKVHSILDPTEKRFKIKQILQSLNGLLLQDVSISSPTFDTIFTFSDKFELHLFSIVFWGNEDGSENWSHWFFHLPNKELLIIGPGISWEIKRK